VNELEQHLQRGVNAIVRYLQDQKSKQP
jgi:hypothetical protein